MVHLDCRRTKVSNVLFKVPKDEWKQWLIIDSPNSSRVFKKPPKADQQDPGQIYELLRESQPHCM